MKEYQILKENQLYVLSKIGLVISVLLLLFSSEIANYNTTVDEAWFIWKNLIHFNYVIIFWSLRKEVIKKLGNISYKIIIYLLLNYFIDQYFDYADWTWNDYLTIIFIIIETLIVTYKKYKTTNK